MGHLDTIERRIEAILFASGEPLAGRRIAQVVGIEDSAIHNIIERIRERYQKQNSPFDILRLDGTYQMCTLAEFAADIRAALELRRETALSQAALEVLAVIAYNQPVTRAFIEEVRGVDCSSLVRSLAEKGLICEAGRMNIPGKPIIYETTEIFLRSFGLASLDQLPTLPAVAETVDEEESQIEGQIGFFGTTVPADPTQIP